MSQEQQPWLESHADQLSYQSTAASGVALTPEGLQALRSTRPWVIFLAILMFIGAGFMLLGGLLMVAVSMASHARSSQMLVGIIYIPFSIIYVIPGIWMVRYSVALKNFFNYGTPENLAAALASQRTFWRGMGIMAIVCIALYFVGIAVFAVITAMSAAGRI